MTMYLIIGLIVQLIIVVERAIRMPYVWKDCGHMMWWVGFISTAIFNITVWPLTIVAEGYNIYNNQ